MYDFGINNPSNLFDLRNNIYFAAINKTTMEKIIKKVNIGIISRDYYGFSTFDKSHDILSLIGDNSFILDAGGVLLCTGGRGTIVLNGHVYKLEPNVIIVAFPHDTVKCLDRSEDLCGWIAGANTSFMRDIQIPQAAERYLFIKSNPCISLSENDVKLLQQSFNIIQEIVNFPATHPYKQQIIHNIMMVVCYGVAGLYEMNTPINEHVSTRQDEIFRNFLELVQRDFRSHHNVEYYADLLCITPKYLSSIVQATSSRAPSKWIEITVCQHAKNLLRESDESIQQIADSLGFTNPSFFTQYFKRVTGQSPKQYRTSML